MSRVLTLAIASDIHYASAQEQARGEDFEINTIENTVVRSMLRLYRHYVWLRHPLHQNHLLDQFIQKAAGADHVIANGDFTSNTAFIGVSDDAACQSATECVAKLRAKFGSNLHTTIGDHELGKFSFMGGRGGMRIASYHRSVETIGLEPFWKLELGRYVLMGVTSSLLALPVYEPDTLPQERPEWKRVREQHLEQIRAAFSALTAGQRVLLFCHDPTALPFLRREPAVDFKLAHIEQTIIGHLHSGLILWKSRMLAGMPIIRFMGYTARRMSTALNEAQHWKPFRVRLCPSLAGIELLKDGGFLTAEIDVHGMQPARFTFHRIAR